MDRYNLISEGMSDPPTPYQSPTGEWAYADEALAIETRVAVNLANARRKISQ